LGACRDLALPLEQIKYRDAQLSSAGPRLCLYM
jgi:hypothetical protein